MWESLLYKEWIKTRTALIGIAVAFVAAGLYAFLKIHEYIRLSGIVNVWESIVQKDHALFAYWEYLPCLAGMVLGIMQYVPELQSKRLKLTLHLPMSEHRIVLIMLMYGVGALLVLLLAAMTALLWSASALFAHEMVYAMFQQLLPWFMAGLAAYLLTAWICIEPRWMQRLCHLIPALLFLLWFVFSAKSGGYSTLIGFLAVGLVVTFLFPFYSTNRFKEGLQ